ncbi:hypothetical protein Tco_0684905 [Tanacetum coccineum]
MAHFRFWASEEHKEDIQPSKCCDIHNNMFLPLPIMLFGNREEHKDDIQPSSVVESSRCSTIFTFSPLFININNHLKKTITPIQELTNPYINDTPTSLTIGRSEVMSTPAHFDLEVISQTVRAQSSRVPTPIPDDPYVAVRQAYLVDTDTKSEPEEAPSEIEECQPLVSRAPLADEELEVLEHQILGSPYHIP